ncbi:diacylglycerol/lipid kinase family protein [Marinifilum sp.]|uniref:diacylglycerol/lipid kinase family protein n=1 Tax=Marinifilum sp. TaxID=2033137 RepID=UPI003BA8F4D9
MKNILFIINPIAGKKAGRNIVKEIVKYLDTIRFKAYFRYSEYHGHISEIAAQALTEHFDVIIAVGGDGTVNETARILVHSEIALGIIPAGSGNGLARHLRIPLSVKGAVERINKMYFLRMDAVRINNSYSFCVAGIGFDAKVSRMFQKMEARGLYSYIIACLKCFNRSKNQNFIVKTETEEIVLNGFMLCFANASQFGNNAYIAPQASVSDGILNLILVRKPFLWQLPALAIRILTGTVGKYSGWKELLGKEFEIRQKNDYAHLDGEPKSIGSKFNVILEEKALQVIC